VAIASLGPFHSWRGPLQAGTRGTKWKLQAFRVVSESARKLSSSSIQNPFLPGTILKLARLYLKDRAGRLDGLGDLDRAASWRDLAERMEGWKWPKTAYVSGRGKTDRGFPGGKQPQRADSTVSP